jgi:hypothetical protein
VKRYYADDSAATSVKVGYRQASYKRKTPAEMLGFFFVWRKTTRAPATAKAATSHAVFFVGTKRNDDIASTN